MAIRLKSTDRKLGDEWTDWGGKLSGAEADSNTGKRLSIGVVLLVLFLAGGAGLFIWYMIAPRLHEFHPYLPAITALIFLSIWLVQALWFGLMVLSIITGKDFHLFLGKRKFSITFLIPIALSAGRKLGISRDRMANSLVKVSNLLAKNRISEIRPSRILILLPRCLRKPIIEEIMKLARKHGIQVHVVAGGSKARELVYRLKPDAILGVACERDLLSGLSEIVDKIPVIAIPNVRPEGPCKNTEINFSDFERELHLLLNKGSLSHSLNPSS